MVTSGTKELAYLIPDLAEPILREHRLLARPIPFFAHYDHFRIREGGLKQVCERYLTPLNIAAAQRFLRAYAFADEFCHEVLRNFYPSLPEDGEYALRTLWGAAMVIDQLLDDESVDPASFASVRDWVAEQSDSTTASEDSQLPASNPGLRTLVSMLEDILMDCQSRGQRTIMYAEFIANLMRMLDAELTSLNVMLDKPPSEQIRSIVRDKSVLLVWVGFQACCLGQQLEPTEVRDFQEICHIIGEVLWIMDDLVDLEEDLERGIWNRCLWRLFDDLGEAHFRELLGSKTLLAEAIIRQELVAREIDEISLRLAYLEAHPRMHDPRKLRKVLSFWLTSWMEFYR